MVICCRECQGKVYTQKGRLYVSFLYYLIGRLEDGQNDVRVGGGVIYHSRWDIVVVGDGVVTVGIVVCDIVAIGDGVVIVGIVVCDGIIIVGVGIVGDGIVIVGGVVIDGIVADDSVIVVDSIIVVDSTIAIDGIVVADGIGGDVVGGWSKGGKGR